MHRRENIGDLAVAFDDQGAGPAVMLLHPFPFDGRAFGDNVQSLIDAGHRVITPDYPDFGDSAAPPSALSIARLADLIADLLDHLKIETIALVGVSMGGYVALAFARRFAARLRALVLADTRAAADGPAARQGRADALALIGSQGVDAYLRQSLPRLLMPGASAEVLARITSLAEKRESSLMAGITALRDRPDRTAELPTIACPTLVVAGAHDQVSPPDEMRALALAIPGARFVEIPSAGHLANIEAPVAFNKAVADFLGATREAPTP